MNGKENNERRINDMARLNIDRQKCLEPERIRYAIEKITALGYTITSKDDSSIRFIHKGKTVIFYPYSGWATGASIKDGRGLQKLLSQLKTNK